MAIPHEVGWGLPEMVMTARYRMTAAVGVAMAQRLRSSTASQARTRRDRPRMAVLCFYSELSSIVFADCRTLPHF